MRITLDLDDSLIEALSSRHPDLSKAEAIEMALRAYLALEAQRDRDLRGRERLALVER